MRYKLIILNGFRGTGKSTVGKKLAEKLGWDFVELDDVIVKKAEQSIDQITQNGTNWKPFRQLENQSLKEVLKLENMVVSLGGGVCVNTVVDDLFGKSYGEINLQLIKSYQNVLQILVTAEDKIIKNRIENDELSKDQTQRPILNEKLAKELIDVISLETNIEKQKEVLVAKIVEDSMETYKIRKPLYAALNCMVIDNGDRDIDTVVDEIFGLLNNN